MPRLKKNHNPDETESEEKVRLRKEKRKRKLEHQKKRLGSEISVEDQEKLIQRQRKKQISREEKRIRENERKRLRRAELSPEERERLLERDREEKRLRRATQVQPERKDRAPREGRRQLTEAEKNLESEKKRLKRALMSPEEREAMLERQREQTRQRRAQLNPDRRERQRENNRTRTAAKRNLENEKKRIRRALMTPEEREKFLEKQREEKRRLRQSQRSKLAEAELNSQKEQNRIRAKIRRALLDPAEKEKRLEKEREDKRQKRHIKKLQAELDGIKAKLEPMLAQRSPIMEPEIEDLEHQKQQLELKIQELVQALKPVTPRPSPTKSNQLSTERQDIETGADSSLQERDEQQVDSDALLKLENFEARANNGAEAEDFPDEENLFHPSNLVTVINSDVTIKTEIEDSADEFEQDFADFAFEGAESYDPLRLVEDEDGDGKRWPDESIDQWVHRMEFGSHPDDPDDPTNVGSPDTDNSNHSTADDLDDQLDAIPLEPISIDQIILPGTARLAALKANAYIAKLQRLKSTGVRKEEQRKAKIAEQRKLILNLMEKYPEEFYKQKPVNSKRDRPTGSATPTFKEGSNNYCKRIYTPMAKGETREERIARIAKIVEVKNAELANETPEQRAARIVEELEKLEAAKGLNVSDIPEQATPAATTSPLEVPVFRQIHRMERHVINKLIETNEEKAERMAKCNERARKRKRMEKGEYNLFQLLINSEDPLKALKNDYTAPSVVQFWKNYKSPPGKVPAALLEWRKKAYFFLNEPIPPDESEEAKLERIAKNNVNFMRFLQVHGEVVNEFLTKRKKSYNEALLRRYHNVNNLLTNEQLETRRRKLNEGFRRRRAEKRISEGFTYKPNGEQKRRNSQGELLPKEPKQRKPRVRKPKGESTPRTNNPGGQTRRKRAPKAPSANFSSTVSDSQLYCSPPPPVPSRHPHPTMPTYTDISRTGGGASAGNDSVRWPTLALARDVHESHYHDDDHGGDDAWTPGSDYVEDSYELPNQSQNVQFGNQQIHQPLQHTGNIAADDFIHRLLHVGPQNPYTAFNNIPNIPLNLQVPGNSSSHQSQTHHHQHMPFENLQVSNNWTPNSYGTPQAVNSQFYNHPHHTSSASVASSDADYGVEVSTTVDPDWYHKSHSPSKARHKTTTPGRRGRKRLENPKKREKKPGPRVLSKNLVPPPTGNTETLPYSPVVLENVKTLEASTLKCSYCSMVFNSAKSCAHHVKKFHETKKQYSCSRCPQIYDTKHRLVGHIWRYHRKSKMFQCPVCPKQYNMNLNLLNHLKTHPSESNSFIMGVSSMQTTTSAEKFWCGLCPLFFDSFTKLLNHRNIHRFICQTCGIIVKVTEHLAEHIIRCHPEVHWSDTMDEDLCKLIEDKGATPDFTCEICDSRFSTNEFLNAHKVRGHPAIQMGPRTGYRHLCGSCNFGFSSEVKRDAHFSKECPLRYYPCYWCSETLSSEDQRTEHITKLHLDEKSIPRKMTGGYKDFKCELCRRSFLSSTELRFHFRSAHIHTEIRITSSTTKHYNTEMNDAGPPKSGLTEVTSEPGPLKEGPNTSTSTSTNISNLPQALIETGNSDTVEAAADSVEVSAAATTSTETVVHPCPICQCNYKTKEFLEKHMTAKHRDGPKEYRVYCTICKQAFRGNQASLAIHKLTIHNHKESDNPRFPCPQCPAKLSRPRELQMHIMRMHDKPSKHYTGVWRRRMANLLSEKKFKCDLCDKSYALEASLKGHKKMVHCAAALIVFCDICGKQLKTSTKYREGMNYLDYHMSKEHPEHTTTPIHMKTPTTTPGTSRTGLVLQRLPLPEVMQMIDEIYILGRRAGIKFTKRKPRKADTNKKPRKPRTPKARAGGAKSKSRKLQESESESSDESSSSSSDEDSFSEDDSQSRSDSDDGFGETPSTSSNPRRQSLRDLVINPRKRRRWGSETIPAMKVEATLDEDTFLKPAPRALKKTVQMPSVVLGRCDELLKNTASGLAENERKPAPRRSVSKKINYSADFDTSDSGSDSDSEDEDCESPVVDGSEVASRIVTRESNSKKEFKFEEDSDDEVSD